MSPSLCEAFTQCQPMLNITSIDVNNEGLLICFTLTLSGSIFSFPDCSYDQEVFGWSTHGLENELQSYRFVCLDQTKRRKIADFI